MFISLNNLISLSLSLYINIYIYVEYRISFPICEVKIESRLIEEKS